MSAPAVDAIIAARDEAGRVGACVDALRGQDYGGRLRICVVDNASTDATASLAAARGAEVLREPQRGRGAARNAGLRATRGQLVAFLDAHVVIGSDWVRRMVEPLNDPRVGGCQSRVTNCSVNQRVQRYLQSSAVMLNERILADSVRGERSLYPWLSTANCLYRRAALEEAGGFNESLVACEDVELAWRVIARGYRLVDVPNASATHYDGRSWLRFVTKGFLYGRGAAQIESLYRPQGAQTTFRRAEVRRQYLEEVLASLSYRSGFRFQQLEQRFGLAPLLEPIPARAVGAELRPWFPWRPGMRLRISPGVIFWLYDERALSVVVQPSALRRYVFEATGDFVWRLLAREQTRDAITGCIVDFYGVAPVTAAGDLDELVEELLAAGLVEHASEPVAGGWGGE